MAKALAKLGVPSARDLEALSARVDALAKGTEAFAAQRMNRGIRKALAGQNVRTL